MIYYCSNCKNTAMKVFNTTDGLYESLCKSCFDNYEKKDKVQDVNDALKHLREFNRRLVSFEIRISRIEKTIAEVDFTLKELSKKGVIDNGQRNNSINKKNIATRTEQKK